MNTTEEKVHISNIRAGDTIMFEDKMTTVSNSNIKYCSFMGITLFGDSYNLGYKLVTRINIKRVTNYLPIS